MDKNYCVMTFHSTHHGLIFEKELKKQNIEVKLMPVPRQISSSCGTAGRFDCNNWNKVLNICKEKHIEIDKPYKIKKEEKKSWFSKFVKK
ncbi:DUF3343 domain-containing protein [Dethiothermospora halolimnae]|uniref:DUF3343 domain-containing protein n=1 Tax=Dethiothermospora halolimnae TaxID=3114390 RepID=UPI003CCC0DE2